MSHHAIDLDEASAMWAANFSASRIAERFKVSRDAILGFAHRNREFFPSKKKKARVTADGEAPAKTHRPKHGLSAEETLRRKNESIAKTSKARMEAVANEVREFVAGTSRYQRTAVDDIERRANGKTMLDLASHECKWPLNDGGPFLFCAEATNSGPWCGHHALKAYAQRRV